LKGLCPIIWDFATLTMESHVGGDKLQVKGIGVQDSEVD